MIDVGMVAKKLALIETVVARLRRDAHPERIGTDVREEYYIEHSLQIAAQAAIDIASHINSSERFHEPTENKELFAILAREGWLDPDLATKLGAMAGFRNVLVHDYTEVDLDVVRRAVEHGLGDLEEYVAAIRVKIGLD